MDMEPKQGALEEQKDENEDTRSRLIECSKQTNEQLEKDERRATKKKDHRHLRVIGNLKMEVANLREDRTRLIKWNEESKHRENTNQQFRRSKVVSPVYIRESGMLLIPGMHLDAKSSGELNESAVQFGFRKQPLKMEAREHRESNDNDDYKLWESLRKAAQKRGLRPIRKFDGKRVFEIEVQGNRAAVQKQSLISGIWPETARCQLSNRDEDEMSLLCTYTTLSVEDMRTYAPEQTMLEVNIGNNGDCWWFQIQKCTLISVHDASSERIQALKATWGKKKLPKQWLFEFQVTKMHESESTISETPRTSRTVVKTGRSARRKRHKVKKRDRAANGVKSVKLISKVKM